MTQSVLDLVLAVAVLGLGWWLAARQSSWVARLAIAVVALALALWIGGIIEVSVETSPPPT